MASDQSDDARPAATPRRIEGLSDLERSVAALSAEKIRREREAAEAEAMMLQAQEEARIASKGYWSEYSGMIRTALERVDDVLARGTRLRIDREPDTRLNEEYDSYEGVVSVYADDGESLCTITIRVEEEDVQFEIYDPDAAEFVPSEDRPKDECRTALDIANIIAKLIGPAVERSFAPKA